MDPKTNPFAPGAGSQPPELAGRADILNSAEVALARIRNRLPSKSLILVGLRGVGKTVLLNRIWEQANQEGYESILIEAHEDKALPELLVPPLRKLLYKLDLAQNASDKVKRGFRVLASFIKGFKAKFGDLEIGMETEAGSADSGDLESDLAELFLAMGEAAVEKNTAICICVDELQYLSESELSALIMAIHRINQRNLPFILIGAGLPQIVGLVGKSKSYAERLFDFPPVGPLLPDDARSALQSPLRSNNVEIEEGAITEIISETKSYPYFLQQWGHEAWNIASRSPITIFDVRGATTAAIANLDRSFFRVRFDRLTQREREYLLALAQLGSGSQRSGDIAEALNVKSQSVAPIRSGLIKKGMIYSPAYGDTSFTVPLFGEFMLRIMRTDGWDSAPSLFDR
ncbi:MAG TPA: AAA family ATPase [Candidatus Acidoferrum sp.]|nr:AAA family ATPase [Candidatus Acidoferrum sp.]